MEACNFGWPDLGTLEAVGQVIYHESTRSWNTLRLSKRIVWEFPLLRDRGARVGYKAVMTRTAQHMEELLKDIKSGKVPPPLLLFFFKQDD